MSIQMNTAIKTGKPATITVPKKPAHPLTSLDYQATPTVVDIGGVTVGGGTLAVMAGPCSIESEEQIIRIAHEIKAAGAHILRGGAFKPRTSPYDFQGLGEEGLRYLKAASIETGLPTITEVIDIHDIEITAGYADCIQIGSRNMQNYPLLREAGKTRKPVLLKRGLSATYNEFLLAAEYIMAEGNHRVILCERGIRGISTDLRFTLDLNAVPYLKERTHLPVIVDPSHGTGTASIVPAMSRAAIACGADGLIIEAHYSPAESISDAGQTISTATLSQVMSELSKLAPAIGRKLILPVS